MPKNNNFKVFCDAINEVLSIKALTSPQLEEYRKEAYKDIKNSVVVDLFEYHLKIILEFVVDGKSVLTKCEKHVKSNFEEDFDMVYSNIIESIYMSVIQVYPNLALENIVQNLNQDTIKGFLNSFLEELYDQSPNEKSNKTGKRFTRKKRRESVSKESCIETLEDINSLEKKLRSAIIGQEEAIKTIILYVKLLVTKLSSNISLLFIGPTGVGKTLISKELGKHY